ncbi:hypothetical protein E8L03_20040 [Oceanidesulfovibrio marinus]|uniref:Nickel/cobalt efflux system n=1 Tax=Oceanidesulfovibrio marinus TaxID=370038 RepID=A0ABX6NLZ3_9BACT|nr:hypothetical protein E8L03_20040 [Oceanidesulfovibrio marinus]
MRSLSRSASSETTTMPYVSKLIPFAVSLCAILAVLAMSPPAHARNPFIQTGGEKARNATAAPSSPSSLSGPAVPAVFAPWLSPVLQTISRVQMVLKNRLVGFGQAMHAAPFGHAFWMFLAVAFLYGVIHAAGPGHGKAFACAYFGSRPTRLGDAGLFSCIAMAAHVLSATLLVLGGAFVLRMSGVLAVEKYGAWLVTASYGLLAAVGLVFTVGAIRELRHHWNVDADSPKEECRGSRGLVATAIAVGMAPCPGAAIVLVFALTQGLLLQGLAAMVAIAVGMSLTTTIAAYTALLARRGLSSAVHGRQVLLSRMHGVLMLLGSLALLCAGVLLLVGQLAG